MLANYSPSTGWVQAYGNISHSSPPSARPVTSFTPRKKSDEECNPINVKYL